MILIKMRINLCKERIGGCYHNIKFEIRIQWQQWISLNEWMNRKWIYDFSFFFFFCNFSIFHGIHFFCTTFFNGSFLATILFIVVSGANANSVTRIKPTMKYSLVGIQKVNREREKKTSSLLIRLNAFFFVAIHAFCMNETYFVW